MHKMRDKIKWKTRPKNKPRTQISYTALTDTPSVSALLLPARIGGARSTEPEPKAETEAEFETETKAIG